MIAILTISSIFIYFIQDLIFHNTGEMLFLIFQDLAFLPIEAALVTFVLDRLLKIMEKREKAKKINVIISAFFTEAGSSILFALSKFNRNNYDIVAIMKDNELNKISRNQTKKLIKSLKYDIYAQPEKFESIVGILAEKKSFLINMLENSNLLEHDTFTDMLWAVFHVADELQSIDDIGNISEDEINHLSNDFVRAYSAIVQEWVGYMFYLHDEYPFLYKSAKEKSIFNLV